MSEIAGIAADTGRRLAVVLVNVTQFLFGAEPYSFPDPLASLPSAVNFAAAAVWRFRWEE